MLKMVYAGDDSKLTAKRSVKSPESQHKGPFTEMFLDPKSEGKAVYRQPGKTATV